MSGTAPGTPDPTTFKGDVDLSLATFSDLVALENAVFSRKVDFTLARFGTDAVFAGGTARHATFARAVFRGPADFSGFTFDGPATFGGAQFADHADFGVTSFIGRVVFDRVRFGKGATFVGATFLEAKPDEGDDSLFGVQADGDLNFAFADFGRPAGFEYVVVTGTMSFSDARLPQAPALHFSDVSAGSFDMDVNAAVDAVRHDRTTEDLPDVLKWIESSAKAKDDLAAANDAHFARQVLRSDDYMAPLRQIDFIFYRTIAGYFVRPFRPLIVLLALASIVTLGRMIQARLASPRVQGSPPATPHSRRTIAEAGARAGRGIGRAVRALGEFATSLLTTLTLIGPARKGSEPERQGRQIEIWTYRILFACALIGFANSNPTMREMFDAVR